MIINPIFFYMMHIADTFGTALTITGPAISLSSLILFAIGSDIFVSTETEKLMYKWARRMIPIGIIILFIGLLIPDKETLLLIQAAKLATTDNVNAVFESLKAAMDYAVTLFQ